MNEIDEFINAARHLFFTRQNKSIIHAGIAYLMARWGCSKIILSPKYRTSLRLFVTKTFDVFLQGNEYNFDRFLEYTQTRLTSLDLIICLIPRANEREYNIFADFSPSNFNIIDSQLVFSKFHDRSDSYWSFSPKTFEQSRIILLPKSTYIQGEARIIVFWFITFTLAGEQRHGRNWKPYLTGASSHSYSAEFLKKKKIKTTGQ